MKKYKKDCRKLRQQRFVHPLLSLNSISALKPLTGNFLLKDYKNMERVFVKNHFRYPHKVQLNAAPEHLMQEQPIVRRITVDLRPVLREAIDLCEEDVSDTENESNSISTAALSDQGLNREIYLHFTSRRLSDQDLQSQNSSISTSGLFEQELNRRYISLEEEFPVQRNSEAISFSLPPLPSCEEKSKPAQKGQRRVNLVEITNTGTLSFDKERQFTVTPPVSFPKIRVKDLPSHKMFKEQRPLQNENTSWLGLDKLQLPISELIRVITEQTNSGQHTLIAKVLCSLREKQEKDPSQHGVLGRINKETSQKIPQIPSVGGEIRLTWIKRS